MKIKKTSYLLIFLGIFLFSFCAKNNTKSPIPSSSNQMILVLTDSIKATSGNLFYLERENLESEWKIANKKINVVIGKNGLGWGRGLHTIPQKSKFPIKREGDGRSPAGVFKLSSVFGYAKPEKMQNLKMPYIHLTKNIECIDDSNSKYYAKIVNRKKVENVDWQSSEKMSSSGIYYKLGIVVEHNRNPIKSGSGSCIFIHNWGNPNEATSGCTEMTPKKTKEIVYWLEKSKNPILVQLTKKIYLNLIQKWELPKLN